MNYVHYKNVAFLLQWLKYISAFVFLFGLKRLKFIYNYWQLVLFPSQMAGEFIRGVLLCRFL
jgi:hypothetical protein